MIIDCFIFYNELDLLRYRLNTLQNVVDYFVLVEATLTHVGKPKKLYFEENKHLFEKETFFERIIHVIVDDFPFDENSIDISKDQQWENEKFQRNCISRGLEKLHLTNADYIIISDLDEIPDPKTLKNIDFEGIRSLEQDFYYYNLNSKMDHKWYHSKIMRYANLNFSNIRLTDYESIKNGGWHLSYFGDSAFISNKIKLSSVILNFSFSEFCLIRHFFILLHIFLCL
jgi:beta-1,4-mannosyl-glycoprotein beta-1,4-N-acetylglucosaminyltransferase